MVQFGVRGGVQLVSQRETPKYLGLRLPSHTAAPIASPYTNTMPTHGPDKQTGQATCCVAGFVALVASK